MLILLKIFVKEAMKKSIARLLGFVGICINLAYILINKFVISLSDWIAIPVLVIAVILIFIGLFGQKYGK